MISKLRRKFIFITMLSLAGVLFTIIATMNVVNYVNMAISSDNRLENVINHRDIYQNPRANNLHGNPFQKDNPEDPFMTRFFSVSFDVNGEIDSVSLLMIASIDKDEAIKMANEVNDSSKVKGYYGAYRFKKVVNDSNTIEIFFLNVQMELKSCNTFLVISSLISLCGYLLVFLLIFFLSKTAVKPFYENQVKQKQFITDASHELKTPLTIINANVEIIEMDNGESEWTESIKKQVKRLTSMTKKMTMLASMDEEEKLRDFTNVNISNLLIEVIEDFEIVTSINKLEIIRSIDSDIVISGSNDLLRELFCIFLENANKYSKGNISVDLHKVKDTVVVSFSNPAVIPDGNLDYLYDRFYRLDSSRNSLNGGSGIGLSLARAIAMKHNALTTAAGDNNVITFKIIFKI